MSQSESTSGSPQQRLSLFDSVCIIVCIIIGAGIFETTPKIAGNVTGAGWLSYTWAMRYVEGLSAAAVMVIGAVWVWYEGRRRAGDS